MDVRALYVSRRVAVAATLSTSEARFRLIGTLRVVCIVAAMGSVGAMVFAHAPELLWWLVAAALATFAGLIALHGRVELARLRARAAVAYFDHGLARLGGDWSASRTGEALAPADHPYASDLDVFGRSSLFQRVSIAQTRFGEQTLAAWLSAPAPDRETLLARQQAARELSAMTRLREQLAVLGAVQGPTEDPAALLDWIEKGAGRVPDGGWRVAPLLLPLVVIGAPVFGPHFGFTATACGIPYALAVLLSIALRPRTGPALAVAASRESALAGYAELFALIEQAEMSAPMLSAIRARLQSGQLRATGEMRRLSTILGFSAALGNEVFRLFVAPIFGFELIAARALETWRVRNAAAVRGWLSALGELEALASFATVAFEDPGLCWPEISSVPCFVGTAVAHPLIASTKRIANDVTLRSARHAIIVTGSNMSGKSTLMRAMGANVVLALAGAPACATRLEVGMLRVATSMRVSDSLADSTSHFYAELKKLKLVLDLAKQGEGVFFLLDEILHGTNSRERLIGARAVVRNLLARGALGAVSTHDLGLSDLEKDLPEQVVNVHFQEQIEADVMTFDYQLREGVVQSSNALRLMRIVGLEVGEA